MLNHADTIAITLTVVWMRPSRQSDRRYLDGGVATTLLLGVYGLLVGGAHSFAGRDVALTVQVSALAKPEKVVVRHPGGRPRRWLAVRMAAGRVAMVAIPLAAFRSAARKGRICCGEAGAEDRHGLTPLGLCRGHDEREAHALGGNGLGVCVVGAQCGSQASGE